MTIILKIAIAVSFIGLLGPPILELWKMLALVAAWLAMAHATLRLTPWRVAFSLALVFLAVLAKSLLPGAAIQEGHNIFLVTNGGNVLEAGLPSTVYEKWRQAFETRFPLEADPGAAWHMAAPVTLYAASSDALWGTARYSRRVDAIDFRNLSEFRGGFANDLRYNFFGNDSLSRTRGFAVDLPFFVMYEFSDPSVGSTLYWRGTVLWERADGSFEEVVHREDAGRIIGASDVGKRAYALHLPAPLTERPWEKENSDALHPEGFSAHLELRSSLAAAHLATHLLGLVAVFGVLTILTRIDVRRYLAASGFIAIGFIIVAMVISFSEGKYLGSAYPPHGGGDDGLTHESVGRNMAREFMSGNWKEAFRGGQSVYWDTPGMRHFRFVEKTVFGDTNLGYAAFVALLPWFLYLLIRQVAGVRWAVAGFMLFVLSPFGSLSYLQYIMNGKLGYAETAAFGCLVLGSYLLMRSQFRWGGASDGASAFCGGVCLAGAMFLRPNLALAVPLLGALFVVTCWCTRDLRTMALAMAGLAFALWMPLHNYLYGNEFVLISAAGATISLPLGPAAYFRALQEFIAGNVHGEQVALVTKQLSGWLWSLPRLPVSSLQPVADVLLTLRLVTLAVTVFAAFRYLRSGGPLPVLAWVALAAHLPMLFVFAPDQFRYAMIGWDLSAIVTLTVVADHVARLSSTRVPHSGIGTIRT